MVRSPRTVVSLVVLIMLLLCCAHVAHSQRLDLDIWKCVSLGDAELGASSSFRQSLSSN